MKPGKVDALLGIVFGDEGKGKVVDYFTPQYDVVARFAGGPNAGHTIIFDGKKFVLRSIPSGIFDEGKINIIGNGCVLAPDLFMAEAKELEAAGYDLKSRLHISLRTQLILPTHRLLDKAYETLKGKNAIGTTGKGIGPTYSDKAARVGLRVGDILDRFDEKYAALKARHERILHSLDFTDYDLSADEARWMEGVEYMKQFQLVCCETELARYLDEGKSVLAEGAQGTMLDLDHGTYPFVSSSNTTCGGVCTGLGVAPSRIGDVFGIFKAYSTRVGAGPFPVELFDETGDRIREITEICRHRERCNPTHHDEERRARRVQHHQGVHRLPPKRQGDHRTALRHGRLRTGVRGTARLATGPDADEVGERVSTSPEGLHPFHRRLHQSAHHHRQRGPGPSSHHREIRQLKQHHATNVPLTTASGAHCFYMDFKLWSVSGLTSCAQGAAGH